MDDDIIPQVVAPDGLTYQWVATDGDPEARTLLRRLANGWVYVDPNLHRDILSERGDRIYIRGLVLMQKATVEVEKTRAQELRPIEASFADLVRKHVGSEAAAGAWQKKT